ncbi:MAG TPA: hypothetical protein VFP84_12475 [Kofleriaceae bacterium]|nr:hypothetical protein [Kofleriaceae bacterium]
MLVELSVESILALDEVYKRARTRQSGFARKYKATMARLLKQRMRPSTIERMIEAIEAVLSAHGLSEHEADVLARVRGELRPAMPPLCDAPRVARAVEAARAARRALVDAGVPPSRLPDVQGGEAFLASTHRLIGAIHDHLAPRCVDDRAAAWRARIAHLEPQALDALRADEAAALVELVCRWGGERLAEDARSGTRTLTGPLPELPASERLASVHLESARAVDRCAYDTSLVGAIALDLAWLDRYPFALHAVVTRRLDRVLGYMAVLPLTADALREVLRRDAPARAPIDLATCTPGQRVHVYLSSVVVRAECDRSHVKAQLRASFLRGLDWLHQRGVAIDALAAVASTAGGRRLLREHGFEPAAERELSLYTMTRTAAPRSVLGMMLHAAAFPVAALAA